MKKLLVLLVLLLTPAFAQSLQGSIGGPFGLSAGIRLGLVPLLLDGRLYASGGPVGAGGALVFGGGADLLAKIPLTDLYLGGGVFFGSGDSLSALNRGNLGLRGVVGTWLNLGLPGIGFFIEAHPMVFFGSGTGFGLSGAFGVNIGF